MRTLLLALLASGALLLVWISELDERLFDVELRLRGAEQGRRTLQQQVDRERRKAEADRDGLERQVEAFRRREEELRRKLAEVAGGGEVRALEAELKAARSRLATLEVERAIGERIIRDYGAGVCLIQGSYGFFDVSGRALRYRVDDAGKRLREADGSLGVAVDGNGPIHAVEYFGTGFLVDGRGLVVTNRHIAEPWWNDETSRALEKDGFRPRLLVLRAFFPKLAAALRLSPLQRSAAADLALLQADLEGRSIPVLPLDASGRGAVPGQPVVVVGYPSGLEAILAKTDSGVVEGLLASHGASRERLVDELARQGLIRPSTTQGHIGDVTDSDVVFDAPTTQGGSGGPVFNKNGRVIAVEYAVQPKFGGNSLGLPVRYALELLRRARS